jgi:hypothetical protein
LKRILRLGRLRLRIRGLDRTVLPLELIDDDRGHFVGINRNRCLCQSVCDIWDSWDIRLGDAVYAPPTLRDAQNSREGQCRPRPRQGARRALSHIPNSSEEVRYLVRYITMENLRQPNPLDDDAPGG